VEMVTTNFAGDFLKKVNSQKSKKIK